MPVSVQFVGRVCELDVNEFATLAEWTDSTVTTRTQTKLLFHRHSLACLGFKYKLTNREQRLATKENGWDYEELLSQAPIGLGNDVTSKGHWNRFWQSVVTRVRSRLHNTKRFTIAHF